jgi:hypothetical protein
MGDDERCLAAGGGWNFYRGSGAVPGDVEDVRPRLRSTARGTRPQLFGRASEVLQVGVRGGPSR